MNDLQLDGAHASTAKRAQNGSSAGVPLLMPNQDLTISEGTIVTWLKQVGDHVKKGEAVVEVETAKAVLAVESPADGTLAHISAQPQDVVALGAQLGMIRPD